MLESADPEIHIDLVHQSCQMSFKGFACGFGSCNCECGDGTTETDMDMIRSLTPQEQQLTPSVAEVQTVWTGSVMLMLDAN